MKNKVVNGAKAVGNFIAGFTKVALVTEFQDARRLVSAVKLAEPFANRSVEARHSEQPAYR